MILKADMTIDDFRRSPLNDRCKADVGRQVDTVSQEQSGHVEAAQPAVLGPDFGDSVSQNGATGGHEVFR
jgi:hypothetical protein